MFDFVNNFLDGRKSSQTVRPPPQPPWMSAAPSRAFWPSESNSTGLQILRSICILPTRSSLEKFRDRIAPQRPRQVLDLFFQEHPGLTLKAGARLTVDCLEVVVLHCEPSRGTVTDTTEVHVSCDCSKTCGRACLPEITHLQILPTQRALAAQGLVAYTKQTSQRFLKLIRPFLKARGFARRGEVFAVNDIEFAIVGCTFDANDGAMASRCCIDTGTVAQTTLLRCRGTPPAVLSSVEFAWLPLRPRHLAVFPQWPLPPRFVQRGRHVSARDRVLIPVSCSPPSGIITETTTILPVRAMTISTTHAHRFWLLELFPQPGSNVGVENVGGVDDLRVDAQSCRITLFHCGERLDPASVRVFKAGFNWSGLGDNSDRRGPPPFAGLVHLNQELQAPTRTSDRAKPRDGAAARATQGISREGAANKLRAVLQRGARAPRKTGPPTATATTATPTAKTTGQAGPSGLPAGQPSQRGQPKAERRGSRGGGGGGGSGIDPRPTATAWVLLDMGRPVAAESFIVQLSPGVRWALQAGEDLGNLSWSNGHWTLIDAWPGGRGAPPTSFPHTVSVSIPSAWLADLALGVSLRDVTKRRGFAVVQVIEEKKLTKSAASSDQSTAAREDPDHARLVRTAISRWNAQTRAAEAEAQAQHQQTIGSPAGEAQIQAVSQQVQPGDRLLYCGLQDGSGRVIAGELMSFTRYQSGCNLLRHLINMVRDGTVPLTLFLQFARYQPQTSPALSTASATPSSPSSLIPEQLSGVITSQSESVSALSLPSPVASDASLDTWTLISPTAEQDHNAQEGNEIKPTEVFGALKGVGDSLGSSIGNSIGRVLRNAATEWRWQRGEASEQEQEMLWAETTQVSPAALRYAARKAGEGRAPTLRLLRSMPPLYRRGIPWYRRALAWRLLATAGGATAGSGVQRGGEIVCDWVNHCRSLLPSLEEVLRRKQEGIGSTSWLDAIEKDVPRTFPNHPRFHEGGRMQLAVHRVLCMTALVRPAIGYCQAMNNLAGVVCLLFCDDDNEDEHDIVVIDEHTGTQLGEREEEEEADAIQRVSVVAEPTQEDAVADGGQVLGDSPIDSPKETTNADPHQMTQRDSATKASETSCDQLTDAKQDKELEQEAAAFGVLNFLLDTLGDGFYSGAMKGPLTDAKVLEWLLEKKQPKLFAHIEKLGVMTEVCHHISYNWFLTVFSLCLPMGAVLRVWDLLLVEGSEVLFLLALAILHHHMKALLACAASHDLLLYLHSIGAEERRASTSAHHDAAEAPMNIDSIIATAYRLYGKVRVVDEQGVSVVGLLRRKFGGTIAD